LKQIALPGATITDGVKIPAGTTRTFVVAFNVSGVSGAFSAAANISGHSLGTQLTNWTFNDQTHGISTPVNADPSLLIAPITGHSVAD
jgi:dihydrodipicolinate synthase/N-acetylneuraminate lyase